MRYHVFASLHFEGAMTTKYPETARAEAESILRNKAKEAGFLQMINEPEITVTRMICEDEK